MDSISIELEKVRLGRAAARRRVYPPHIETWLRSEEWGLLQKEKTHKFDTSRYPLLQTFCSVLGLKDVSLDSLHRRFHGDQGSKKDRREKTTLLEGLRDPDKRASFLEAFESLVLHQIIPWIAEIMRCDRVVFQSFPCVRVHRPHEFSIGPHCDAQYQLPEGNLNVYLPLTKIWHTNSLYLETEPGLEDFHPLMLDYGEFTTFNGCLGTHFAVENLTDATRVSLDFRVAPGNCFEKDVSKQTMDFKVGPVKGSYYSEAMRDPDTGRFTVTQRGTVNHRHGFPHTNK